MVTRTALMAGAGMAHQDQRAGIGQRGLRGSGRVVPAGLAPIVSENADPGSGDRFGWAAIGRR